MERDEDGEVGAGRVGTSSNHWSVVCRRRVSIWLHAMS